jgi:hypothetical protein
MEYLRRIADATRCFGGLWKYLIARTSGRTAIELERERNRATEAVLQLLPAGAEMLEYEHDGRLRVIRMPQVTDVTAAKGVTDIGAQASGELQ